MFPTIFFACLLAIFAAAAVNEIVVPFVKKTWTSFKGRRRLSHADQMSAAEAG